MQDSREIDYFGQRILQIVQPLAAGENRREVLALLAQSVANNFAADGCWVLHYPSPGVVRVAASACFNHRTTPIAEQLPSYNPPSAPNPTLWRMPLLPDYQVMVTETRDGQQVNGCLMVATKGVEWYRETKLVLQVVADYVSTALIEEELHFQAQISNIYPKLHYQLAKAIAEDRTTEQLFEVAISDMVGELKLKRGLVLALKSTSVTPPKSSDVQISAASKPAISEADISDAWDDTPAPEPADRRSAPITVLETESKPQSVILAPQISTQVQIVTTIDARIGGGSPLPQSFVLENSHFCQEALANAPNPTIFDRSDRASAIDRLIFQDDRLPSIAMIPLMGAASDREPSTLWGWLVLQHHESRRWHPVELKLLQCQIYQIALARIHKKSLQKARSNVANRTSQVQILLQIQTKLLADARSQMEKLKQANDLKDEFISTIGHELRTPLTSMSLAIKMLHQPGVEPERRQQYLEILDEQCRREIKLVNNLLKMQQLESKQVDFRPQPIALNQFISEQATLVADRWTESKSLELTLHLPQVSPQIETDAESLKYIIEELLVNSGKFALPETAVEVWLSVDREIATIQTINLSKQIPSAELPELFGKFRRGSGTTQQAISGTGLGLSLVKGLVEHIKGEITVASEPVDDTTAKTSFTVTIPTTLERQ
jgi:signal transduction histidine kinase